MERLKKALTTTLISTHVKNLEKSISCKVALNLAREAKLTISPGSWLHGFTTRIEKK